MAYGPVNVGQAEVNTGSQVTTDSIGVPGGLATLGGDGKLTTSQMPTIDAYTKSQTDSKVSTGVSNHNSSASAHSDIRAAIAEVEADVRSIDLKYGTNVTQNAFTVTFGTLSGLTVTGVWNQSQARVEF